MREEAIYEIVTRAQTAGLDQAAAAVDREQRSVERLLNTMARGPQNAGAGLAAFTQQIGRAQTQTAGLFAQYRVPATFHLDAKPAEAAITSLGQRLNALLAQIRSSPGAMASEIGAAVTAARQLSGAGFQQPGQLLTAIGSGAITKTTIALAAAGLAISVVGVRSIQAAAQMERYQVQWETLLGSVDAAKARMAELSDFAQTTPFELPEVVNASRLLEVFTRGAISTGKGLQMVGDAAAGTGQRFEEVAFWVGRLYDDMKNGAPLLHTVTALQQMGIVSGAAREQYTKLSQAVASGTLTFGEAWKQVETDFGRFDGLMNKLAATFEGKMSNLSDALFRLFANIGEIILPAAKIIVDALILITAGIGQVVTAIKTLTSFLGDSAGIADLFIAGLAVAFAVKLPALIRTAILSTAAVADAAASTVGHGAGRALGLGIIAGVATVAFIGVELIQSLLQGLFKGGIDAELAKRMAETTSFATSATLEQLKEGRAKIAAELAALDSSFSAKFSAGGGALHDTMQGQLDLLDAQIEALTGKGKAMPEAIAAGMDAGRPTLMSAMSEVDRLIDEATESSKFDLRTRVLFLRGFLMSKALADGLANAIPEIRGAWQRAQEAASGELGTLLPPLHMVIGSDVINESSLERAQEMARTAGNSLPKAMEEGAKAAAPVASQSAVASVIDAFIREMHEQIPRAREVASLGGFLMSSDLRDAFASGDEALMDAAEKAKKKALDRLTLLVPPIRVAMPASSGDIGTQIVSSVDQAAAAWRKASVTAVTRESFILAKEGPIAFARFANEYRAAAMANQITIQKATGEAFLGVAAGIRDRRSEIDNAIDQLNEDFKNRLSRRTELARLGGVLTSKELARNLRSSDPLVVAQAKGLQLLVVEQLESLGVKAGDLGGKAGKAYAAALKKREHDAAVAANKVVNAALLPFGHVEAQLNTDGYNAGLGWGNGLARAIPWITWQAEQAAKAAVGAFGPTESPPPPSSPLHNIDKWGLNTVRAFGDGLRAGAGYVAAAARQSLAGVGPAIQAGAAGGDAAIATQLSRLVSTAGALGERASAAYVAAIADQDSNARSAAARVVSAATIEFARGADMAALGRDVMVAYADGIASAADQITARTEAALAGARRVMEAPGPNALLHEWGERTMRTFADGILSGGAVVSASARAALTGAGDELRAGLGGAGIGIRAEAVTPGSKDEATARHLAEILAENRLQNRILARMVARDPRAGGALPARGTLAELRMVGGLRGS